jgi:hypothetical protein
MRCQATWSKWWFGGVQAFCLIAANVILPASSRPNLRLLKATETLAPAG